MDNLGTIQFRNGIYQGAKSSSSPESFGIYFDDDLHFHCSEWKSSLMNNHTAILVSHAKYIYGEWRDGVPHGFNVFRTGENVVLAVFENGEVVGDFIVIFQRQGYVIVGSNERGGKGDRVIEVLEKREFKNEVQLKKLISSTIRSITLKQQHFSFVKYLNTNFCFEKGDIKLYFEDGVYNFGYENGLRVVFDDDICIHKIGNIDDEDQMCGLGVLFDKIVEIGNFSNGLVMKYKENQKPTEEIKKLFKNQHKRAINFRNDFMFTKTAEILGYLESLMKTVINVVSKNPVDTERSLDKEDLNESMEYRPRAFELTEENERLKMIREELHRSIGLPSTIKPSPLDKTSKKYTDDIKQLHLLRKQNEDLQQPESISFVRGNGKTKEDNRKSFVKQNKFDDYRDKSVEKEKMVKGSRTYYNEPILVGKSDIPSDNTSSNKSINRQSKKYITTTPAKSPNKISNKYEIEKSPSRSYIPKESQVSTAHKNDKYTIKVSHDDNKSHNTNKKYQPHVEPQMLDDSLQSPYRKHLFTDSARENESKKETRKNSSREYIPISHNKTVNAAKKSPPKKPNKEVRQLEDFKPKEARKDDLGKPQSYIALYKNNSPSSNKTEQKSPPKKTPLSPLKNPYYQRQARSTKQQKQSQQIPPKNSYYQQPPIPPPPVYTKQPLHYTNPYLKKSQQLENSRKVSPQRARMLDKISKKYNYTYDNL